MQRAVSLLAVSLRDTERPVEQESWHRPEPAAQRILVGLSPSTMRVPASLLFICMARHATWGHGDHELAPSSTTARDGTARPGPASREMVSNV